jgi:hypothetical protein
MAALEQTQIEYSLVILSAARTSREVHAESKDPY